MLGWFAREIYTSIFLVFSRKILLRPPTALDARSVNLCAELFVSTRFRSAIYEPDLQQSHYPTLYHRALFTRHCARILSKFYVEFQACPHLHSRRRHKRSLLRARTRDLRDTAREMKFNRGLVKAYLGRRSTPQNFKTARSRD